MNRTTLNAATEELCWEALLNAAGGADGSRQVGVRYRHRTGGAVLVAGSSAGGHVAGDPTGGLRSDCGAASGWLLGDPGFSAGEAARLAPLLDAAVMRVTALRGQGQRDDIARWQVASTREFVHAIRQDISTVGMIIHAAIPGPLDPPHEPYLDAIRECSAHSNKVLDRVSVSVRALAYDPMPVGLAAAWRQAWGSDHAKRPEPEVTVPAGEQPRVLLTESAARALTVTLLDAHYASSRDVAPSIDIASHRIGWAVEVGFAGQTGTWERVGGTTLDHLALMITLLDGRVWSGDGTLGFALPAV